MIRHDGLGRPMTATVLRRLSIATALTALAVALLAETI